MQESKESRGKWTIGLVGGLTVRDPEGKSVKFATRKSGAILAMLVLRNGMTVSRMEIGEALWPTSLPDRRSASMRQAIAHLMRSLGHNGPIAVTRTSCRLLHERVDSPDLQLVLNRAPISRTLLPEMTEAWFEMWRRQLAASDPAMSSVAVAQGPWALEGDAAAALMEVVGWCVHYRPRATLEVMRALPELVQASVPGEVIRILDATLSSTPVSDKLYGWGLCQRGIALGMIGYSERCISQLEAARERAIQHRDRELFVECCFYITCYKVLTGDTEAGLAEIRQAHEYKLGKGNAAATIRLKHGMGLALIHHGEFEEGLQELRDAAQLCDPVQVPFERAYLLANLSWMEATCGDIGIARDIIVEVRQMPAGQSWRIVLTCLLTEIAVNIHDGAPVSDLADRVLGMSERFDSLPFAFYARELLAADASARGDKKEGERQLGVAASIRKALGFGLTAWDRHRIDGLGSPASAGKP